MTNKVKLQVIRTLKILAIVYFATAIYGKGVQDTKKQCNQDLITLFSSVSPLKD